MEAEAKRGPPDFFSRPVETLGLFLQLLPGDLMHYAIAFSRGIVALAAATAGTLLLRLLPTARQGVDEALQRLLFVAFWVGLGVLSSVGMGSGLHTFVLYLAPKVTRYVLASWDCGALAEMQQSRWALFPQFVCPAATEALPAPTVLALARALQPEATLWGLGTTLGELPPFLISRSARLAKGSAAGGPSAAPVQATGRLGRVLRSVKRQLKRSPFLTILLLASFPNPFFDACGLVCGYSLVPFWVFFAATLVGKAGVKAHLQLLLVVVAFSQGQLDGLLRAAERRFSRVFGSALRHFIERQRRGLTEGHDAGGASLFTSVWNTLLLMVLLFYAVTLVNARVAQFHARRLSFPYG